MLHFFLLFIIYAAFISLDQPLASVGLITLVLTVCSAASGFFSGQVVARLGAIMPVVVGLLLVLLLVTVPLDRLT